jgi:thymidylate synthase (FAD)
LCNRAQWEVREVAEEMLHQVRVTEPELFEGIGPNCVQLGKCPEGRFNCGRVMEMMTRYHKVK